MKTAKRILTVALALMLIFALAAPSFASDNSTAAQYTQNASGSYPAFSSDGSGTVYLTILSNKVGSNYIARYNLPVPITSSDHANTYCTAYEALLAADTYYSDLVFRWGYDPIPTGYSHSVTGVKDTTVDANNFFGISLSPIEYDKVGYMFRIEDKFPILASSDCPSGWDTSLYGPCGASLEEAYITNGQHITVYFANAMNVTNGTKYQKIHSCNYDSSTNTLTFCAMSSRSYYGSAPNYKWTIGSFTTVSSSTVDVLVNGVQYTAHYISGSNPNTYEITGITANSGTNTLIIPPTFKSVTTNYSTYNALKTTGAYCEF